MISSDVRCKFSQLVSDHVFGYGNIQIGFAIVYLELLANKVWQDGCGACLSLDRRYLLAGLGSNDGQPVGFSAKRRGLRRGLRRLTYGTMLGPEYRKLAGAQVPH
jgi:hypothetical protein